MTPQEIFYYKLNWKSKSYKTRLHSDIRGEGKAFCRENFSQENWNFVEYSDVYEDTYEFKNEEDAKKFALMRPEFTNL
jgi:hypothetical protein